VKRAILLTGQPGTGKTALIKEALARTGVKGGGFYTEEMRTGGIRQGFRIVTLGGHEAILAHASISSPCQVSKYRVDRDALDRLGVAALRQAVKESDLIVIDEIGKMGLLSPRFKEVVTQAINSGRRVLGTLMLNPHPFADEIKRHPEVEVLLGNRGQPPSGNQVLDWLARGGLSHQQSRY
jgi:nucleoside-triphosphatase